MTLKSLDRGDKRAGDCELLTLTTREQTGPTPEKGLQGREHVEHLVDQGLATRTPVRDDLEVLQRRQPLERLLALRHVGEPTAYPLVWW